MVTLPEEFLASLPSPTEKCKFKGGSGAIVGCRPELSIVIFHDGAADREPHPKATLLGRLEGIEHLIKELGIESLTGILDLHQHSGVSVPLRFYRGGSMARKLQQEIQQSQPFASLEEEAMLNLARTADRLQSSVRQMLKPFGLTPNQYNALRILRGAGPGGLTCSELGKRLISEDPDITRLLDRLAKLTLVHRRRNQQDRRKNQPHCRLVKPWGDLLCGGISVV